MAWDYEQVAVEVLRSLRGPRSQIAFSRRLGFRSNVAYSWESGRRFPSATGFVLAARASGVDLQRAFEGFSDAARAPGQGEDWADRSVLASWLDALRADTSVSAVARRAGRHRAAVGRWLAGAAEPRLPDLLCLVDALTDRLLDFVAAFVDPGRLPSLRDPWTRMTAARTLAGATPWAVAVLLALELDAYRAQPSPAPGWITNRLGLPDGVEQECIDLLVRAGQVRRRGQRYEPVAVATIDAPISAARIRSFWAAVARARLDAGADGVHAWNLGVVSAADLARIVELQRRMFREMRSIVAASEPAEEVIVVSWAMAALRQPR